MNAPNQRQRVHNARRYFLQQCGVGLGSVALQSYLQTATAAETAAVGPLAERKPHHKAKAKNVIFLFMAGAPSHLDLLDRKPKLAELNGTLPPKEMLEGYRAAFINPNSKLLGPVYPFKRYGKSGVELSTLLPHLGSIVDDIAIVRSMQTDAFNHAPAQIFMNTGSQQFGRPSLGAWTLYGLGTENQNLPGFVVLQSGDKGPSGGTSNHSCGFLPTVYSGVPFRGGSEPVLFLSNPNGIDNKTQRDSLDVIARLNRRRHDVVGDPEIAARIEAFELAYRMQSHAPDAVDLSKESDGTLKMYGAEPGAPSFANNCLLARRLVERGVRFVQLFHEAWDHHGGLRKGLDRQCRLTDQPAAALIKDLKQRGLLDETLVIWGGEFGRTPMVQGGTDLDGRDHHPNAFTMWMAGGGIKPGLVLGETDELAFNVTRDPVHVHDLHATILHLLGFDHLRLTHRFQGRDYRLTDVFGRLVPKLFA